MMDYRIPHERLLTFIALYKKHYDIELTLADGESLFCALLGLLETVRQGAEQGRLNNAALVNFKKTDDEWLE